MPRKVISPDGYPFGTRAWNRAINSQIQCRLRMMLEDTEIVAQQQAFQVKGLRGNARGSTLTEKHFGKHRVHGHLSPAIRNGLRSKFGIFETKRASLE